MSVLTVCRRPARGVFPLQTPPPPAANTYDQDVNDLPSVLSYWKLDPNVGSGLADQKNLQDLQIGSGGPLTGQPTIVDNDSGGASVFFNPVSGSIDWWFAPHNAAWNVSALTVLVHFVAMQTATKNTVISRDNGANDGSWSIEVEPNGVLRFAYVESGGSVINLRSGAGYIETGKTYAVALAIGGSTVDAYALPDGGTTTSFSSSATVVAPTFNQAISFGVYVDGTSSPHKGIISRAIIANSKLNQTQCESVMQPNTVVHANAFDAGDVGTSTTEDIDPLDRCVFEGAKSAATITFPAQPSDSTFSALSSGLVRITTGATTGADSGTYTVNGSSAGTVSFSVVSSSGSTWNNGNFFGSTGWGAAAGNGGGIGYVFDYWSMRWKADRTSTIERFRWDIPRRTGYFDGTGGTMRLTIYANDSGSGDVPDLGNALWTSNDFVFTSSGGTLDKHPDLTYVAGFGTDEIVGMDIGPVAVTKGTYYHFVFTNEHADVNNNWYSINSAYNQSLPGNPYHPFTDFNTLTTTNGGSSWGRRDLWIPFFMIRYDDGVWTGQNYFDCGGTAPIISCGSSSKDRPARQITNTCQIRQRWTHDSGSLSFDRWRGRIWRISSNTTDDLRIRVRDETAGSTLADVTVPASSFTRTDYDNQAGQSFSPIDVALGATVNLTDGNVYHVRLNSTGNSTVYGMRAPIGYAKSYINVGWGGWRGRGEYSTNGGSNWTGMHAYGTDNRDDCDWAMCLYKS